MSETIEPCSLRRLNEFRLHIPDANDPNAYFREDFENSLSEIPQKRKQLCDIDAELQLLDQNAWEHLKAEAIPYLTKRNPSRGWEQFFNILNQAKAYNYLVRQNCDGVHFVPKAARKQTPDLEARRNGVSVLCEVKTINISKDEANDRASRKAKLVRYTLSEGIFKKFKSNMELATGQMRAYDETASHMLYCIVNFDDSLHEYSDDYRKQLEAFARDNSLGSLEVVFDIKPPFYSAMS